MKKNLLKHINLVLGSISMTLAGCHVQKQAAETVPVPQPDTTKMEQPAEPEPILCKYGVPPEFYDRPTRKYGVPDAAE